MPLKPATYADLLALPEDVRAEVIAGDVVTAPAALPHHSNVQRAIGGFLVDRSTTMTVVAVPAAGGSSLKSTSRLASTISCGLIFRLASRAFAAASKEAPDRDRA